jgi:beta-galactosidase
MGNSNGSLSDYYDLFKKYFKDGLQGGFIWEWIDHGLWKIGEDGKRFLAYGGDFGEKIHDANFVCDGLLGSERDPHPACYELKYLARPVDARWKNAKKQAVVIKNLRDFKTLDDLEIHWEILNCDGLKGSGKFEDIEVLPNSQAVIKLDSEIIKFIKSEAYLNLIFKTKKADNLLNKNHEVVTIQLPCLGLSNSANGVNSQKSDEAIEVEESNDRLVLSALDYSVTFNTTTGLLESYKKADRELLSEGPILQLWRAPTDNDGLKLWSGQDNKSISRWKKLGLESLNYEIQSFSHDIKNKRVLIDVGYAGSGRENMDDIQILYRYEFKNDGRLRIGYKLELGDDLKDLPRVGVRLGLPKTMEQIKWWGLGPWENYSDRQKGAIKGNFTSSIDGLEESYVMPQENGHRCGIENLSITADEVNLTVHGKKAFEFNYSRYSSEELFAAKHRHDLKVGLINYLYLDQFHRGIGTGSCGPDTLDKYKSSKSKYTFKWTLHAE